MSEKKITCKWFDITQYEQEGEYLRKMHQSGWKLQRVWAPGIYLFRACEPEDVVYQLDYNQEGIQNKEEYVKMFLDCGWEYLFDFVGYSYFRKPVSRMDGEETIFCDDRSRLEMMKRIYKGRMLPLILVFLCVLVPELSRQWSKFASGEVMDFWDKYLGCLMVGLFVLYLVVFLRFTVKYLRFKRGAEK